MHSTLTTVSKVGDACPAAARLRSACPSPSCARARAPFLPQFFRSRFPRTWNIEGPKDLPQREEGTGGQGGSSCRSSPSRVPVEHTRTRTCFFHSRWNQTEAGTGRMPIRLIKPAASSLQQLHGCSSAQSKKQSNARNTQTRPENAMNPATLPAPPGPHPSRLAPATVPRVHSWAWIRLPDHLHRGRLHASE